MARTTLTPHTPIAQYPVLPLVANSADLTFAVADVANGNDFVHTGREQILVRNSHATTAYTFTISPAVDRFGRAGADLGPYTLQAGDIASFGPFPLEGYKQSDGKMWLAGENAAILIAVIRHLPMP